MKPLEVQTADVEEMECELHSKEFFVQVGMLVLEGRMPQQSDKGRIEGKHCSTLKRNTCHTCDDSSKECKEARTQTQLMESHWQSTCPLVVDVLVQLDEERHHLILLEQWTVKIVCSASSPRTSGSQLLQAVRSHIHFSQLSAWLISSKGVLPYDIKYRIIEPSASPSPAFFREPVEHLFPLASLPSEYSLQVMVKSLPRCTVQELLNDLHGVGEISGTKSSDSRPSRNETSSLSLWFSDGRSPLRKRTCLNKVENGKGLISKERTSIEESFSVETKTDSRTGTRKSNKDVNIENRFLKYEKSGGFSSCKSRGNPREESKLEIDSDFLNLGASSSNYESISESNGSSNGISNLSGRIEKLGREIANIDRDVNSHSYQPEQCVSGLSKLLREEKKAFYVENKDNVPDTREKEKQTSCVMAKMVLQRKRRSLSEKGVNVQSLGNSGAEEREVNKNTLDQRVCNTKQSPTRQGTASNSSDVDIHAIRQPLNNRDCTFRRSVQLPFSACTEPVFNPKTGLPISSSPAPLRSTNELYEDTIDFTNGLSNKVAYRELSKLLSRSAPASTTQSLLVNFEESVLNGRMEPVGTVEGFTAELSASGSFCPRHVKLPIISCFYRLSDDDAPSPYMGYITLRDAQEESIGRRGYHVPKKGTIQLTVFNPNMTVVKMFVVLYDCSDMPPRYQTFLRQKTYSALKGNEVKNEVHQTLHYLLHLRFSSSKSGKIYLHTDIRVMFARQLPDLGNVYRLFTITDGPTNPKYTTRHHVSEDPEY